MTHCHRITENVKISYNSIDGMVTERNRWKPNRFNSLSSSTFGCDITHNAQPEKCYKHSTMHRKSKSPTIYIYFLHKHSANDRLGFAS